MNLLPVNNLIELLRREGGFVDIQPVSVLSAATKAAFFTANDTTRTQRYFLKVYQNFAATACQHEADISQHFKCAFAAVQSQHACIAGVQQLIPLPENRIASIQDYAPGISLADYLDQKKLIPAKEAYILQQAFQDFATFLSTFNYIHRDICPKNFVFDGHMLALVDFMTGMKKTNPIIQNPSVGNLNGIFGLGAGFNPWRGTWNDTYSVALTYQAVMPLLLIDEADKKETLEALFTQAEQDKTITPEFHADEDWRKKMRKTYWKMRLRPLWLAKKSSRIKRGLIQTTLKKLLDAEPRKEQL